MSKRVNNDIPAVFRFMCLRSKNTNYHKDFSSKEELLEYANSLNDPEIEWYGLYELNFVRDTLDTIDYKRLKPYSNNTIKQK